MSYVILMAVMKVDDGFTRLDKDIRELRGEVKDLRSEMNARFDAINSRFDAQNRNLFGFGVAIVAALIGVNAF